MNALQKAKLAVLKFIGANDKNSATSTTAAECPGCKLLEAVIAERDELLSGSVANTAAAVGALRCRQVKPDPLTLATGDTRYAVLYMSMQLFTMTIFRVLKRSGTLALENRSGPLPADCQVVSLFYHAPAGMFGVVLHSAAFAELAPDDPLPLLDITLAEHEVRKLDLAAYLAPSVN